MAPKLLLESLRSGPLAQRNFALFLSGFTVTLTGSTMVPVALTFAVLGQGGGPSQVSLVLGAETLALVVLLLFGGVVADRMPRKVVMATADVVRCAGQAVLAAVLFTGVAPLPLLMGMALILGAGQAFSAPALTGLVPVLVPASHLQRANALIGVARSTAQIAGPALAGLVVATGGAAWAIAADASSYAISAACLLALRLPDHPVAAPEPFVRQLRLGWGEFTAHRWLWIIVLQFGFVHMLVVAPTMVLGAVVAETHLGGATAWGLILAAQGAGAVLGGLGMLNVRPSRPLALATLATFGGVPILLALAVAAPLPVDLAAAALSGAGFAVFTLLFDTTMQREVPPEALSRVSSYDWLGSFALIPVGYVLAGPLAALLGTGGTLWFSAAWLAATSAAVLASPAVHGLRDRDPARAMAEVVRSD